MHPFKDVPPARSLRQPQWKLAAKLGVVTALLLLFNFIWQSRSDAFQAAFRKVPAQMSRVLPKTLHHKASIRAGTVTLLIPVVDYHFPYAIRNLLTLEKYCTDCKSPNVISILLSSEEDRIEFKKQVANSKLSRIIPHLTYDTFDEVLERNLVDTFRWNSTSLFEKGRFQYISLKRLYGCKSTTTDICWPVDSESTWVRPFSMADITRKYAANPYIISTSRLFDRPTDEGVPKIIDYTRQLLGIEEFLPWVSEEYFWVYGKEMWAAFYEAINKRYTLPDDLPPESEGWFFIDFAFAAFVAHRKSAYNEYTDIRLLDTANMFGREDFQFMMKHCPQAAKGILEHGYDNLAAREEVYPMLRRVYDHYDLRAFRSRLTSDREIKFIKDTKSIILLPSDQRDETHRLAMEGYFTE